MTVRIGLNGFGRIGQNVFRAWLLNGDAGLEIVAVNDLAPASALAQGLRFDSVRGPFPARVKAEPGKLIAGQHSVRLFQEACPDRIPWETAGVDVVIEATGAFRDGDLARAHIREGGPRKVIISASARAVDAVLVYGVNDGEYDPEGHDVISPASCGVNALAVMATVIEEQFGLTEVTTDTLLPIQPYQFVHDGNMGSSRGDPRLGRSAHLSIIPHLYVEGDLLTAALPGVEVLSFSVDTVPTNIAGKVSLKGVVPGAVSVERVNEAMRAAAAGPLQGVLAYAGDPTVSIDASGTSESCVFDPSRTQVAAIGHRSHVRAEGWFDGESGFPCRLLDLARLMGARLLAPVS